MHNSSSITLTLPLTSKLLSLLQHTVEEASLAWRLEGKGSPSAHPGGGRDIRLSSPFPAADAAYLSASRPGEDFDRQLDLLLEEHQHHEALMLQLPLQRGIAKAVEYAQKKGFSLEGFLPHWFTSGDGMLLQRIKREPLWKEIQVLPGRGTALLEMVRQDWEKTFSAGN